MPIPQDQTVLKSYFETNDTPTQAQFAELIDTMFALVQDLSTQVDALEGQLANRKFVASNVDPAPIIDDDLGVASVVSQAFNSPNRTMRITFDEAFADTDYSVFVTVANGNAIVSISKSTGHCDITIVNTGTPKFSALFLHS